ncbi:MAG TPA: alpha-isopropylmalate synthase regulatory domain-containing protein [Polyangiaceae bacterium]|nr:alpha-isopropylmalate synthase regulatory domain-containing protein [Polyangiaceae bacterium]
MFDDATFARHSDGSSCKVVARLRQRGTAQEVHGVGAGPIEAFVTALSQCLGTEVELSDYSEHTLSEGASARAVAYVSLRTATTKQTHYGVSEHEDVVLASFRAIVSACNRLLR